MTVRLSRVLLLALLGPAAACTPQRPDHARDSTMGADPVPAADTSSGWTPLFDGTSLAAWRGYRMDSVPTGWVIQDGVLARTTGGGDLITRDQYGDFELELEWKISPKGNSGIMYRVTEEAEDSYETGPEMQVLDDEGHRDGLSRLTAAGADYGLYPSPAGVVRPAGEWNSVRIVITNNHVEHWLNGTRVVEYTLGSDDWKGRVAASKFAQWPGYGQAARGHIALQDHGDPVWYRNVRIRKL